MPGSSSSTPADGEIRLISAVRNGIVGTARDLLRQGVPVATIDGAGRSGLHLAIERESYGAEGQELVAMFLNRGLPVDARDSRGRTAMHSAMGDYTYRAGHKIDDLIRFGADIEARDLNGRTPLHHAVLGANSDVTKMMLTRGANAAATDDKGYSVLHAAAAGGNATVIRDLINAGADIHAVTFDGKTVWDAAMEAGNDYQAQSLKAEAAKAKMIAEEKRRAREEAAAQPPSPPAPPPDPWRLLDDSRVAFSKAERSIGYQLTEIFNFSARTYTQITQNLSTKAEAVILRTFDEFTDKTALEKAHAHLERLGGKADAAQIEGPMVDKRRFAPKLPQPPQ